MGVSAHPGEPVLVLAVCFLPIFVVIAPGGGRLERRGRPFPVSTDLRLTGAVAGGGVCAVVFWVASVRGFLLQF